MKSIEIINKSQMGKQHTGNQNISRMTSKDAGKLAMDILSKKESKYNSSAIGQKPSTGISQEFLKKKLTIVAPKVMKYEDELNQAKRDMG